MVLPQGNRGDFSPVTIRRLKAAYFTIEGLNSFTTVIFLNYLYFLTRDVFGFDNKRNLALAALLGLVYTFAAWQAGKFAQRRGYFTALKTGFILLSAAYVLGFIFQDIIGLILAAMMASIGTCFIWPTLEALVSENETADRVPHLVGIYNVVWAVSNASAFFIGGTLIKIFGFKVIVVLPLMLTLVMLAMVVWLQKEAANIGHGRKESSTIATPVDPERPSPVVAACFLRMAWLANPFAYIGINTLIAVIPGIAAKFQLSPMGAGFVCSLWCFVRLGTFVGLWRWTGWHYRFHWLAGAFALLVVSFATILMSPSLIVLMLAQAFFGSAIGLIYYSSLFYSMDAGDAKGEHGGIHEAVIGVGNCVGPAVGAAALQFLPQMQNSGAVAVSMLLLGGLGGLLVIRNTAK
jgi:predicted MFS family arabinose efflux permease